MCGIAGFSVSDLSAERQREALHAMLHELRFRGPDAQGTYFDLGIAMGHRRLSVIDLQTGGQPMTDPARRATISFNGEIYNFLDLRQELESQGVRFLSRSDTEVLLQGYLRWGLEGVLGRAVGMFALAVWDHQTRTLLLARDRLGVKPLYWAPLPHSGIAFASELTALVAGGLLTTRLNGVAAANYLSLGYVAGEEALLEPVRRLRPGTFLTWKAGSDAVIRNYWDLNRLWMQTPRRAESIDDLEGRFGELLTLATKQRLVSDVPLGAFLSGGLDSTCISALMKRLLPQVDTFSIGFSEDSYDESPWSRMAAQVLGTRHHEARLQINDASLIQEISARQDEPFADTSIVPTYFLCQYARQHVTVALSGDGADELLAGYVTHVATALQSKLRRFPHWATQSVRFAVGRLPDSNRKVSFLFKAKQFVSGLDRTPCDAHASWRMLQSPQSARGLLSADFRPSSSDSFGVFRKAYEEAHSLSPLDRFLYVDYKTWLLDDILVKVDRASMAHGLEVRSPFLDHRLVEFCAGLPTELKRTGGVGKQILRRFSTGIVPDAILRRKKSGFNAPVSLWMNGPWKSLVRDVFSKTELEKTGFLDFAAVDRLLVEHSTGQRDHGYVLFSVFLMQLWLRRMEKHLR